jgi:hypothetical protein
MRRFTFPLIALALMLPGCAREDDFDKKYEATDARVKREMNRLDNQMETELKREPGEQAAPEQTPLADKPARERS